VGKVGQVLALGLVQLQGARQRVEHDVGDPGEIAALELGVVLDAHTGEVGHLAALQPRHAPVETERRQAGALRGEPGPPGGEEVPDFGTVVHLATVGGRARVCGGLPVHAPAVTSPP
jgi:hypothetical protein